jgi:hypothetical protein
LLRLAGIIRTCLYFNQCGKSEKHNGKKWLEHWRKFEYGYLCNPCYKKMARLRNPESVILSNSLRVKYKGKYKRVKTVPRKGLCKWCGKKIGDEYINCFGELATIKQTQTHHFEYNDNDVLMDTVELCSSCHSLETQRQLRLLRV